MNQFQGKELKNEFIFSNSIDSPFVLKARKINSDREAESVAESAADMDLSQILSAPWALQVFTSHCREMAQLLSVEATLGVLMRVVYTLRDGPATYRICQIVMQNRYKSVYEKIVREEGEEIKIVPFHIFGRACTLSLHGSCLVAGGMGTMVFDAASFAVIQALPTCISLLGADCLYFVENGSIYRVVTPAEFSPLDQKLADFPGAQCMGIDQKGFLYFVIVGEIVVFKEENLSLRPVFRSGTLGKIWPSFRSQEALSRVVWFWTSDEERGVIADSSNYLVTLEERV